MNFLNLVGVILLTVLFGGLGIYAFYHTFKSYKNNKDLFLELPIDLYIFSIVSDLLLWVSKKFVSEKSLVKIYRILTFCFGLIMIAFVVLFWGLIIFN